MTATVAITAEEIGEIVRDARNRSVPLRVVGGGTWLDAGSPVESHETISVAALNQVIEYVPGDLTITAGAGTSLRAILEITAAENQWLGLDPMGTTDGTIGATLATGSYGPLATGFGTARDLALGVEFVTGRGEVVKAGGRVVKNVAGFDLTRLMIGAWGTLGILTEITLRLHARPEREVSLASPLGGRSVGDVVRFLAGWPFTPLACEVVNGCVAGQLGLGTKAMILFRLAGNSDAVSAQCADVSLFGDVTEMDSSRWTLLRGLWHDGWSIRFSRRRSAIADAFAAAEVLAAEWEGALVTVSPARSVVRCALPSNGGSPELLARLLSALPTASRAYERLPVDVWQTLSLAPTHTLSERIRATYDPDAILNRGIMRHTL